jgi:hypothetical protein
MSASIEHGDYSDLVGKGEWTHLAVPPGCGCPECHEWCPDLLEWIDDNTVRCETCGMEYQPARTAAQKGRRTDDNA